LSAEQAAMVKGVFLKSRQLRVEMMPRLEALRDLLKALGVFHESPPASSVTVNQVNVGNDAVETVRRVAFLLASAENQLASSRPAHEIAEPVEPPAAPPRGLRKPCAEPAE
jgi:hypothetical protein